MKYDVFFENGRLTQFLKMEDKLICCLKCTTTSISLNMEDDLNFFENWRRPPFFRKCTTTSTFWNGRRPHFFWNWRRHKLFFQKNDDLNILRNRRQPQKQTLHSTFHCNLTNTKTNSKLTQFKQKSTWNGCDIIVN